ncbi:hypothetical protein [Nocardia higoensis]|uniref:hypothetical protein n=1 Tax=Nocardia higoensis TaxID=228599 RepID=UPI000308DF45|nr:hypothetical protein [Nocardia higoensis]
MGGAVREVLAGSGVCLLVAAVLAFVFACTWHVTRPPQARGRTGRVLIDTGLALTAAGLIVAVAGLVPIRSAGTPDTLPAATTAPAPSSATPRTGGAAVPAPTAPTPPAR